MCQDSVFHSGYSTAHLAAVAAHLAAVALAWASAAVAEHLAMLAAHLAADAAHCAAVAAHLAAVAADSLTESFLTSFIGCPHSRNRTCGSYFSERQSRHTQLTLLENREDR